MLLEKVFNDYDAAQRMSIVSAFSMPGVMDYFLTIVRQLEQRMAHLSVPAEQDHATLLKFQKEYMVLQKERDVINALIALHRRHHQQRPDSGDKQ